MSSIIEIKNLTYQYTNEDRDLAIKEITKEIKVGEFVAIIGHNGSGKSTLAKLLNALLMPTTGDITVDGLNTKDEDSIWEVRQTAGMVFQNPDNQIVATIVEEDVAFGPENLGLEPKIIVERVNEALQIVDMDHHRHRAPHLLSGGQKQRIAIAGVIAMKPKCIIFDEPTAMLDPSGRREVLKTIKKLNREENMTIIHITHFMEEAVDADRIIVMEEGKIILEGTPREVFSEVSKLKELGLDVPQVTELAHELIKEGVNIPKDILTVDEMVMHLCQLK
ncbi:energy-coupling factor transporter ATPase [Serpentinicella alkaliphila]|uniref:Energy-coupling factor transport system ATP-binding protein n=1 Tax=Serpentinicella alkaliphila TaxID=1734049 RepID=A0A4R2TDR1_9FIRM|nr:energy-coupling factor transporter ATPase [Serpentinicella alkaliphila]QUH25468.1 energy-coupling factor transporter ATPase [Serpentinicella alkaliphila]TCQ01610.1 energy-coupling factor transport system ATP-binding protein [Serpentinicella alkaliphila]